MVIKLSTDRLLDYVPRLDERNLAHRVTAAPNLISLADSSRYWTPGVVLDQGNEGACVGFGTTGEYIASPVRGGYRSPATGNAAAAAVYRRAKEIDEWEGVAYDGTSVRAGMLVGRERGWWTGFRWALNLNELRTALETGPIVIGVEWTDGMYGTDRHGSVIPTGDVVGGHCLLVTGYSPNWNGWGPHYRWRNSWGTDYGRNGSAYIRSEYLDSILFRSGGEAAVAVGRHL